MNNYGNDESTVVLGDAVISGYEWPEGQDGPPLVDRETIVFLHYFGGAASSWKWVAGRLSNRFRCVCINLPGFGCRAGLSSPGLISYVESIRQTLAEHDVRRCRLVGHSMGGKIAMAMAASDTDDLIERVLLIAPSPATFEPMIDQDKDEMERSHPSPASALANIHAARVRELPRSRIDLAIKTNMLSQPDVWSWWLRNGMNEDISEQAAKIRVSVSVLASIDDTVMPIGSIRRDVVEKIPGATCTQVDGIGHLMPLEDDGLVADWIERESD